MQQLQPGAIVSIDLGLGFEHLGIISDRVAGGMPMVISNSRRMGGVTEEGFHEFSEGKAVKLVGFPGTFRSSEILERAKSMIGSKYDLIRWNCEHFVRWAHGLNVVSTQISRAGVAIALLLLLAVGLRKKG